MSDKKVLRDELYKRIDHTITEGEKVLIVNEIVKELTRRKINTYQDLDKMTTIELYNIMNIFPDSHQKPIADLYYESKGTMFTVVLRSQLLLNLGGSYLEKIKKANNIIYKLNQANVTTVENFKNLSVSEIARLAIDMEQDEREAFFIVHGQLGMEDLKQKIIDIVGKGTDEQEEIAKNMYSALLAEGVDSSKELNKLDDDSVWENIKNALGTGTTELAGIALLYSEQTGKSRWTLDSLSTLSSSQRLSDNTLDISDASQWTQETLDYDLEQKLALTQAVNMDEELTKVFLTPEERKKAIDESKQRLAINRNRWIHNNFSNISEREKQIEKDYLEAALLVKKTEIKNNVVNAIHAIGIKTLEDFRKYERGLIEKKIDEFFVNNEEAPKYVGNFIVRLYEKVKRGSGRESILKRLVNIGLSIFAEKKPIVPPSPTSSSDNGGSQSENINRVETKRIGTTEVLEHLKHINRVRGNSVFDGETIKVEDDGVHYEDITQKLRQRELKGKQRNTNEIIYPVSDKWNASEASKRTRSQKTISKGKTESDSSESESEIPPGPSSQRKTRRIPLPPSPRGSPPRLSDNTIESIHLDDFEDAKRESQEKRRSGKSSDDSDPESVEWEYTREGKTARPKDRKKRGHQFFGDSNRWSGERKYGRKAEEFPDEHYDKTDNKGNKYYETDEDLRGNKYYIKEDIYGKREYIRVDKYGKRTWVKNPERFYSSRNNPYYRSGRYRDPYEYTGESDPVWDPITGTFRSPFYSGINTNFYRDRVNTGGIGIGSDFAYRGPQDFMDGIFFDDDKYDYTYPDKKQKEADKEYEEDIKKFINNDSDDPWNKGIIDLTKIDRVQRKIEELIDESRKESRKSVLLKLLQELEKWITEYRKHSAPADPFLASAILRKQKLERRYEELVLPHGNKTVLDEVEQLMMV